MRIYKIINLASSYEMLLQANFVYSKTSEPE